MNNTGLSVLLMSIISIAKEDKLTSTFHVLFSTFTCNQNWKKGLNPNSIKCQVLYTKRKPIYIIIKITQTKQ